MTTDSPSIAGPHTGPEAPYPIHLRGTVVRGFGRGSKELGIPTGKSCPFNADKAANLPSEVAESATSLKTGIHYGFARVGSSRVTYPMVMSYGWNPYYKNIKRTAEVHVLHTFQEDFYGEELRVVVLGYIRDEKDYVSVDALVKDIGIDIMVARNSLERDVYFKYRQELEKF